jgi:adenylate cyclase
MAEGDVVRSLLELGIPQAAIDRAVKRGDPEGAIFDSVLLPGIAQRTVSAAEIEAAGGLEVGEIQAMIDAFGLPPPEPRQPAFTPEEARVFTELRHVRDVWPDELALQVSRVYGRMLARIAQTELQLFRTYVEPRLRAETDDPLVALGMVQSAFARLLPLTEPIILGVHRRWFEHELAQAAVQEVETGSGAHLPGAVEVAFLFCDLKDFTAYAEDEGDLAAVQAIDRFVEIVTRERGGFRFMKALGDGAMLAYGEAGEAVEAGARIIEGMRAERMPGVHASVHYGVAILREGDYFGGAVNLAARLLTVAGRDELMATRPVVESGDGRFEWEPAGAVRVRGVTEPVPVFRLARAEGNGSNLAS